jgi:predicted metalloprotease with PDZ domain
MGDVFGGTPMIKKILIALCLMCVVQPAFAGGRGYLGVWFANLPATEKVVQTGVVVNRVFAGSAAQQAGLKPGEIVTQIDGVFVRDPKTAVALLAENAAGERISLTVIDRTGGGIRQSHVFATLAANPPSEFAAIMTAKRMPPLRPLSPSSMSSRKKRAAAASGSSF